MVHSGTFNCFQNDKFDPSTPETNNSKPQNLIFSSIIGVQGFLVHKRSAHPLFKCAVIAPLLNAQMSQILRQNRIRLTISFGRIRIRRFCRPVEGEKMSRCGQYIYEISSPNPRPPPNVRVKFKIAYFPHKGFNNNVLNTKLCERRTRTDKCIRICASPRQHRLSHI